MPFLGKLVKFVVREAAGELVRNCAGQVGQKIGERIAERLEKRRRAKPKKKPRA